MITQIWAIGLVILAGIIGGFGPIYLKKGSDNIKEKKTILLIKSLLKNKELLIGIFIYGLASLLFIFALKGGELSFLYPLVSLTYVWLCVYSKFMLKEKMTIYKWTGISIIILGVALISVGA